MVPDNQRGPGRQRRWIRGRITEMASGIQHPRLGADGRPHPVGLVVGHAADKTGQGIEELVPVKLRVEQKAIGAKGRGDVGEAELQIHLLTRGQRVGQLIFVEVNQRRRSPAGVQGGKIGQAHHAAGDDAVEAGQIVEGLPEMKGRPAHAPLPEAGRQRDHVNVVVRMGGQPLGEIPMGAAVKRFKEKEAHAPTGA
ncbi:hypothetical protein DESC_120081 [Desulfosarcina cetonica]|nr:hypothetical protein DESC_120081 [Desulfosarcina cetonica]